MNVGLALEIDESVYSLAPVVTELGIALQAFFAERHYGSDVENIVIGVILVAPDGALLTGASEKYDDERDLVSVFEGRVNEIRWEGTTLLVLYGDSKRIKTPDSAGKIKVEYRPN
jgi:hypothetical protein